jgi:hypothetical protein
MLFGDWDFAAEESIPMQEISVLFRGY